MNSPTFTPIAARPSPTATSGWVNWPRQNLFSSPGNTATTLFLLALAIYLIPGVLEWGLFQAVFAPSAEKAGPCWLTAASIFRQLAIKPRLQKLSSTNTLKPRAKNQRA